MGPCRAFYAEDALIDPETVPPHHVRLRVGDDISADLAYRIGDGLIASERARHIISQYCTRLDIRSLGHL